MNAQKRQHPLLQCKPTYKPLKAHSMCTASKLLTCRATCNDRTEYIGVQQERSLVQLLLSRWKPGFPGMLPPICVLWPKSSLRMAAELRDVTPGLTEVLVAATCQNILMSCLSWGDTHHDSHERLNSMSAAFRVRCHSSSVLVTERICPCFTASRAKQKREQR